MAVSIVLADDNKLIRKSLKALLETETGLAVIGEARDGVEALRQVKTLKPDVLVLDLMMPRISGLEVLARLQKGGAPTASVVLSIHNDPGYIEESLRLNARAYISKDAPPEDLIAAIISAATGRGYDCRRQKQTPDDFEALAAG